MRVEHGEAVVKLVKQLIHKLLNELLSCFLAGSTSQPPRNSTALRGRVLSRGKYGVFVALRPPGAAHDTVGLLRKQVPLGAATIVKAMVTDRGQMWLVHVVRTGCWRMLIT